MDVQELLSQAEQLALAGDVARAEAICDEILRQHPQHAEALYLLGMLKSHAGDSEAAVALLERAVSADAKFELAYASLGAIRLTMGQVDDAIENLSTAVALDPEFADAHSALADALTRAGRTSEAAEAWQRVTQLQPENGAALNQLAAASYRLGLVEQAVDTWIAASELLPNRADIHANTALALYQLRRTPEGLAAAERGVQVDPNYVPAHYAIFQGLSAQRRFEDALAALDRLIAIKPDEPAAHYDRGTTLIRLGELDAADADLQSAVRLRPEAATFASTLLMLRNYLPGYDPEALYRAHVEWAKQFGRATEQPTAHDHVDRNPDRPLRVGFVSTDFRDHPVADFTRALMTHHDRKRFHFVGYSDVTREDRVTADFRELFADWRPIVGRSDDEVERMIRADQIDILIDLVGHSTEHRLLVFARRPAPIQLSYLGYCNTTGLSAIDYILGDAITDPPGRHQPYAEALLSLPGTFACYAPLPGAPQVNALPASQRADRVITFGSTHALPKLNEQVIALWSRVLHATPGSRMLLFRDAMTAGPRGRLTKLFAKHGIDPSRLEFRNDLPPGGDPLSVYHDIDISLDTFPWSGHTTACEAMWMGVPMITLRGPTHAGRMAASAITHAGQPQWVAEDTDRYASIAADLARDIDGLSRTRQALREQMRHSRLCDAQTFTREFEGVLRTTWRTWCQRNC